jgi:hypothetical protein
MKSLDSSRDKRRIAMSTDHQPPQSLSPILSL